jgi:hypothetical protein
MACYRRFRFTGPKQNRLFVTFGEAVPLKR